MEWGGGFLSHFLGIRVEIGKHRHFLGDRAEKSELKMMSLSVVMMS